MQGPLESICDTLSGAEKFKIPLPYSEAPNSTFPLSLSRRRLCDVRNQPRPAVAVLGALLGSTNLCVGVASVSLSVLSHHARICNVQPKLNATMYKTIQIFTLFALGTVEVSLGQWGEGETLGCGIEIIVDPYLHKMFKELEGKRSDINNRFVT